MEPTNPKRPHPLRLAAILLVLAALYYLAIKSPFLAFPALLVVIASIAVFFIVRGLLRWKFPEQFQRED